jgi:hypothetical protein
MKWMKLSAEYARLIIVIVSITLSVEIVPKSDMRFSRTPLIVKSDIATEREHNFGKIERSTILTVNHHSR